MELIDEYRRMLAEAREALAHERSRRTGDLAGEFAQLLSDADDQLARTRFAMRQTPQTQPKAAEADPDEDFTTEAAIHQLEERAQ